MSAADNGGPAFPQQERVQRAGFATHEFEPVGGMTLLDYFIAHAPAEPQQWFEPAMPTPRPELPKFPESSEDSAGEISYVREYGDVMKPEHVKSPELRAYVEALAAKRKAIGLWDTEARKQLFVQWPCAWANAMLKARAS